MCCRTAAAGFEDGYLILHNSGIRRRDQFVRARQRLLRGQRIQAAGRAGRELLTYELECVLSSCLKLEACERPGGAKRSVTERRV